MSRLVEEVDRLMGAGASWSFIQHSRMKTYRAKTANSSIVDQIFVSITKGEKVTEFCIESRQFFSNEPPDSRICIYSDAWSVIPVFSALFQELALMEDKGNLNRVARVLIKMGFRDNSDLRLR